MTINRCHAVALVLLIAVATMSFPGGAELEDPDCLLQGTSKGMRHVRFVPGAKINRPAVVAIIKQAEKMKRGPVMVLTVMPNGPVAMGKNLVLWFIYSAVIGVFAAYVAGRALPAGAPYLRVFQLVGVTAFIGYSVALWEMSIWFRRAWSTTIKGTVDGLIYALITAGTFGWLWPRQTGLGGPSCHSTGTRRHSAQTLTRSCSARTICCFS